MAALSDQRIAEQRIFFGPRRDALAKLQPAGPILLLGSKRSAGLLDDSDFGSASPIERFTGATPHNPQQTVDAARALADRLAPATIVAIGSSSAVDLGKAVWHERSAATLVTIPTALGGAEMTRGFGVLQDGRKAGKALAKPSPVVVYDEELLASLPNEELGSIGANAFAHTIEAHYAKYAQTLGVAAAARGGADLAFALPQAVHERTAAMHRRLFAAAYLAGYALNSCGMGFHHAVCHVLGAMTGIPHGIVNAVVLPHAVRANAEIAPDAVAAVARAFGVDDLAACADRIATAYALPRTLAERGASAAIVADAVPAIEAQSHVKNNPAPVPAALIERVVRLAVTGAPGS